MDECLPGLLGDLVCHLCAVEALTSPLTKTCWLSVVLNFLCNSLSLLHAIMAPFNSIFLSIQNNYSKPTLKTFRSLHFLSMFEMLFKMHEQYIYISLRNRKLFFWSAKKWPYFFGSTFYLNLWNCTVSYLHTFTWGVAYFQTFYNKLILSLSIIISIKLSLHIFISTHFKTRSNGPIF